MAELRTILTPVRFCVLVCVVAWIAIIFIHFPYHHDVVSETRHLDKSIEFYDSVYDPQAAPGDEDVYVQLEKLEAATNHVEEKVRSFVDQYRLQSKRVLDIGAGRGYLQRTIVEAITQVLDISSTARRYVVHKPFVQASATEIPFLRQ